MKFTFNIVTLRKHRDKRYTDFSVSGAFPLYFEYSNTDHLDLQEKHWSLRIQVLWVSLSWWAERPYSKDEVHDQENL